MLYGPKIFRVHDIGTVFILESGHKLIRATHFLKQENFVRGSAFPKWGLAVFIRAPFVGNFFGRNNVARQILCGLHGFVFPPTKRWYRFPGWDPFVDVA